MKKTNHLRRNFLKGALAAAVAPSFVPSTVFGATAPSNKFTMGFLGTGNNGTNWLRGFLKDERVRVIAVCDVNREGPGYWDNSIRGRDVAKRIVDEHYGGVGCGSYEDFRDVIARDDIDGIYIGTPDHWHAIMAIAAANAGKDVYGQKPLSLTIAEGRAMSNAIQRNGVVWQTGSQQRSDSNFRRACELVRNGRIGKLHTVRCGLPGGMPDYGHTANLTDPAQVPKGFNYDMWLGPSEEEYYCPARVGVNFRWNLNHSGGQLTDWGGHHPDIAQWGMDTEYTGPVAIKNPKAKWAEHPVYNTATEYYFECEYKNGLKLIISDKEKGGVTFEGSDGWVWANRGNHKASSKEILESKIEDNEIHLYESDDHITNFVDCVFSRKETIAPVEVAHRSISLAHLGNIAMILGRDIKWDPEKEKIIGDGGANFLLKRAYRAPWVLEA